MLFIVRLDDFLDIYGTRTSVIVWSADLAWSFLMARTDWAAATRAPIDRGRPTGVGGAGNGVIKSVPLDFGDNAVVRHTLWDF